MDLVEEDREESDVARNREKRNGVQGKKFSSDVEEEQSNTEE